MAGHRESNKKRKRSKSKESDQPAKKRPSGRSDESDGEPEKPPMELEEGWGCMEKGIAKLKKILEGSPEPFTSKEYMSLYTTIYTMCTQKPPHDYTEQLYAKYKEELVSYINTVVLRSLRAKHGEFMLRELVHRWRNHTVMVKWLSRFFSYLDRYYIPKHSLSDLKTVGLRCFREKVYDKLKTRVTKEVLALVERERDGEQIDRGLVKNVVDVIVAMATTERDVYGGEFEDELMKDSKGYYSRKASNWIVEDSCPEYMLKAEECLKKERERVANYLQSSTEEKLLQKVHNKLVVVYATQLIEKEDSGCRVLFRDNKTEDLSRMYRLFRKTPKALESVANFFKQHVTAEGIALVKQAEESAASAAGGSQEHVFVTKVMELHDKYMGYTMDCFASNSLFHKAMKDAFDVFCNKNVAGSPSAELLAAFLDSILKKGDEAIEKTVDKVVKLLDYVSEKDLFGEFHRKKLARRLLFDKSVNDGNERLILTKLKQQHGKNFTMKMEGMVTDLTLAKEIQPEFSEYLGLYRQDNPNPGIDLTVTVLTTGSWPTYKSPDLNLPEEMAKAVQVFKEYYQLKSKVRRLTWIYSLGSCQVNGKFDQKTIELIVGVYQAAVLQLFNLSDKLSYSEIKTQLNLEDQHLAKTLHSLSCGKYKILIKEPNSKTVTAKDTFTFNSKFSDKMRRIRIPMPVIDERKKVVEDVDKERRYAIDACIVRIMKSRKVLGHQLLVTECVEQLSRMFKPDFKVIKRRIEHLISQEYLERDQENPNLFRYLA